VALSECEVLGREDLPPAIAHAEQVEGIQAGVRSGRLGFDAAVARFEEDLLRDALERSAWNQTRAAAQLGITRRQLKLKMDRYGIEAPAGS